ncbi:hypothetical protein LTR10_020707 [Elasticomyces elasticus]|uniref:Putative transcription factor kapC n=1 Tax=Exophiala sideris TaxID=1016849 RepID=A0A0D1YZ22_9EURO|nr:hypothetical protein LTR10_020707 [Elasticomyces elasticus]KAK5041959.1 hypothetical protein LTR13_001764 [Exophiala sideris]KAK5185227.1 hypothetical protein LTR44_002215 [Eurotiomycetes sp. CCFEE 6388]KIV86809.1 hypothetical protein, variant [Exophiala sideris]
MTSITQLLSPWPVSKHSIVLREQHYPPPQSSLLEGIDNMSQHHPSPPTDPASNDGVTASAESDQGEGNADGRKGYGKRELSTSKRAAQNRAAQRAFRQRKEGYIKKLEEQVRDYQVLSENFKAVQAENYQLRDYIINLQSRLLESQGEVPPPPSNVDGLQPGKAGSVQQPGTLPRLSELGAIGQPPDGVSNIHQESHRSGYPDPTYAEAPATKRARTGSSEMTASQAALQGPAILSQPPTAAR